MIGDILRLIKNFVLVIGPKEAGKTSILKRMVTGNFLDTKPTYGLNEELIRKIRVIEIGGQDNYQNYWRIALEQKPVHIFFVVDITKPEELKVFSSFIEEQKKNNGDITDKLTLCANKSDLTDQVPDISEVTSSHVICSAKNGTGILDILELIATFGHQEKMNTTVPPVEETSEDQKKDSEKINSLPKDYEGKL